ncbi:MAG: peptidoglycan DD-metalloendopeptidase family protein [Candidatus Saccharibacteria bacterium]|nr:peptidoglycan DD-metalloendopeptidase family protein [Candidatus Saccharibacteria bacterium]
MTKLFSNDNSSRSSGFGQYLKQSAQSQIILTVLGVSLLVSILIWSQLDRLSFLNPTNQVIEKSESQEVSPLLDLLTTSEVALNLAELVDFRETAWIETQAYNSRLLLSSDSLEASPVIDKPVIINSTIRTRHDILPHITSEGDTVISLANRFKVSANSIRLSNGLLSNTLEAGRLLFIPPIGLDGIVYEVKPDDTVLTLAGRFNFIIDDFLHFNDIEDGNQLPVGELIFIPHANLQTDTDVPTFWRDASLGDVTKLNCHGCNLEIKAGEVIGKLGNTGWSTGPHLHIEILSKQGRAYNPWSFINQNHLVWPVEQDVRRVTQVYHPAHRGLDIGHDEGTDILAIADGTVIYRGCLWAGSGRWATFGIIIDHHDYYSLSIHLQAPNHSLYQTCNINLRSQYGQQSIDYTSDI